ncbi:MAG: family 78 glycoside hydrolase catalytic domain [Clostridia bacterium]|nr:family 78 glycoside hydrolase catalytic domain [Clostridia bacterium]
MNSIFNAKWIKSPKEHELETALFKKDLSFSKPVERAVLNITSHGVYEAFINGERVGDFILAPGWTDYIYRLQYQEYDITDMVSEKCELTVSVGGGWFASAISRAWHAGIEATKKQLKPTALIASLDITYTDGTSELVVTDEGWEVTRWDVAYSDIYHGETYIADAKRSYQPVELAELTHHTLIPTEGERITEQETLVPVKEILTPKGERVIDFGQEITGYVEFDIDAKAGQRIVIDHAEVLDSEGNFYNENLRSARVHIDYTCREGKQSYKPHHTFMGFRYIRLTECPEHIPTEAFKAIVVHSKMKRTGYFRCSNEKVNKLYSNLVWGQKGNFLDVPTDCPQRDERLGWTGDAQAFIKTAAYNYDIQKFFNKWLNDLVCDQTVAGAIPHVIPDNINNRQDYITGKIECSAAWADSVTICPWQIYLSYADKKLLEKMLPAMEKYISYMLHDGDDPYVWATGGHFGDWLSMELTDKQFIADAFYAYSTSIVIKVLKVLGRDTGRYEKLYTEVVKAFRKNHPEYTSQTECVLALHFALTTDKEATAKKLVELIHNNGDRLTTGFVGTPYLLHVLSENGYSDVAYTLLLQEKFPSWLFSVNMGATTIWEHWDSLKEDGTFWSTEMNSFNHYAYGSVGDWMYGVVCGVKPREDMPGYKEFDFAPIADSRLDFAEMEYETRYGVIKAGWNRTDNGFEYNLTVPAGTRAHVKIGETDTVVEAGEYKF